MSLNSLRPGIRGGQSHWGLFVGKSRGPREFLTFRFSITWRKYVNPNDYYQGGLVYDISNSRGNTFSWRPDFAVFPFRLIDQLTVGKRGAKYISSMADPAIGRWIRPNLPRRDNVHTRPSKGIVSIHLSAGSWFLLPLTGSFRALFASFYCSILSWWLGSRVINGQKWPKKAW